MNTLSIVEQIERDGFAIAAGVYDDPQVEQLLEEVEAGLALAAESSIKSSRGETYAARNLVEFAPQLLNTWKTPAMLRLLAEVLGDGFGLVRVLYFDKHPNRTWSLPWHKDMTIAVKDNSLPTSELSKPTRKSGVDHVEASVELLEQMLTLRIHLDKVTEDNGPLEVAIGSHKNGKSAVEENNVAKILVNAGDVLAMRPLVSHASGSSTEGTALHRRILHLEFAAMAELPDGFEWNLFAS
jgi:hypothetical protein